MMNQAFLKTIAGLESYLRYAQDEGTRSVAISSKVLADIASPPLFQTKSSDSIGTIESQISAIATEIAGCTHCVLHETRKNTVPGQGNLKPEVLFIGEAPGEDEDEQGIPFVGRAGQLLTKMIQAMGFSREDVFIANIIKCRPPSNRTPSPEEMTACLPFLLRQIAILQPKVIVLLGGSAVKGLLKIEDKITRVRGVWTKFKGIDTMPTFHPSYLLRSPSAKREAWEDLKAVLKKLGRTPPSIQKA